MAKIRQSNLDGSVITGNTTLNETANLSDLVLVYDQSSGTLKQISRKNLLGFPTISSVSPTSVTSGDGTGNYTFTITGTSFTGSTANLVNNSGTTVNFDTTTIDSDTQITGVIAKSSLPGSGEPYDIKVLASNGLSSILENQINIDQSPTYNTAAGSLGSILEGSTINPINIEAYDPESAGNVTFEIQSGALPPGLSATTINENGVSKYRISGTMPTPGSETVYSFVLRAVDAASNTTSRSFSITARQPVQESFTSSGTFSVPSGITSVDVLVVAAGGGGGADLGAGGGAGGLIYIPSYPVTPGGTVSVTVGCGGSGSPDAGCANKIGGDGQDSVFGTLTAKGGGGGSGGPQSPVGDISLRAGRPGGSGGGGSGHGALPAQGTGPAIGGTATQPTQPGQSGAYGFGNAGGGGNATSPGTVRDAGGGGGAGAAGQSGQAGSFGGIGKAYTIADGTTPVYYAGGGAGVQYSGGYQSTPNTPGGAQGGGGAAPGGGGSAGQANKGGGGGANGSSVASNTGGKGIVIVAY